MSASGLAETAYSALRVVGAQRGEEVLKQVIEVRSDGTQQPAAWKIVVLDPHARAGVREIEVRNGRIANESTPKKARQVSGPMDLAKLNLDSEGVVEVINQEKAAPTCAERIDYTLANRADGGAPVWTLKMRPPRMGTIATMEIAADTGEVLSKTVLPTAAEPGETDPRQPALADSREERRDPEKAATKKRSPSRSRERVGDVPDEVKSLIRRVEKPVRFLRRFLP